MYTRTLILLISIGILSNNDPLYAQEISFSPQTTLSELQEADGGSLDLGDIDLDGDLDLVILGTGSVSSGGIRTTLYLNDGDGFFTEVEDAGLLDATAGEVRFIDVDDNGALDILVIASNSSPYSTASLYMNDGTGQFTLTEDNGIRPSRNGGFDFGDVDADGDGDLIVTGIDQQFIDGQFIEEAFTELFLNDGTGTFTSVQNTPFEALVYGEVRFLDMEGDGDLDIILAGTNEDDLVSTSMYANNGTGTYSEVMDPGIANVRGGTISIADSDNDGDEDILICGSMSDMLGEDVTHHYLNDGQGGFSLNQGADLPQVSEGSVTDFADLDNDGDMDILIFGLTDEIIGEIYENTGNNIYQLADTMYGSYLSNLTTGDIDGDGDDDLLVTGSSFDPLYPTTRTTRIFFNDFNSVVGLVENRVDTFSIYPNPVQDVIRIKGSEAMEGLVVVDMTGKVVFQESLRGVDRQVDMSELTSGAYILQITSSSGIQYLRFLKD